MANFGRCTEQWGDLNRMSYIALTLSYTKSCCSLCDCASPDPRLPFNLVRLRDSLLESITALPGSKGGDSGFHDSSHAFRLLLWGASPPAASHLVDAALPDAMDLDPSIDPTSVMAPHPKQNDPAVSSDDELDAAIAVSRLTVTESRLQQNAIFETWANVAMERIGMEQLSRPMKAEEEEQMSLKSIMARHENSKKIIASPRDYQMELFERAKTQNTIAVLDTGSGKTLIAVLLLRHTLDLELERRAAALPSKIAFFVVDKVMLCQQQAAVLSANLDHSVAQFTGNMRVSSWDKSMWRRHFTENMVIVCTAEVLVHCLAHSFITIGEISLLIFDEAHHAKKGHGYAKIIRDFYIPESDLTKRPRIFGTTASPIDVSIKDTEVAREQARELEELLDAKIATPSDPNALRAYVQRPQELATCYTPFGEPFETQLYGQLWREYQHLKDFEKMFVEAKDLTAHLGAWCSDKYWSFAFSERQAKKVTARAERYYAKKRGIGSSLSKSHPNRASTTNSNSNIDTDIKALDKATQAIRGYDFGVPTLQSVSDKVYQLYHILAREFERTGDSRVLVFVERRNTAMLLHLLFTELKSDLKNMACGYLVGNNVMRDDGINISSKDQVVTLMKFRKGEVNCLFATSAAEEGIDIQGCNVVVRFDPVKTMIQYIQSRGRARHLNSKLYHMLEQNNEPMYAQVSKVIESASIMTEFATLVPEDRILKGLEDDETASRSNEARNSPKLRNLPVLVEPSTGAKITFDFALVVLAHFAACLPHEFDDDLSINYIMGRRGSDFVCEVILPEQSPVKSAMGQPYPQKTLAKRSAALEACRLLRDGRYLDDNMLPIYVKQLPAMRNARLAVNDKASSRYPMLQKPSIWARGRGIKTTTYYLTIIDLTEPWQRPTRPLGLITREPLPDFPQFPIYRIDGRSCAVATVSLRRPMDLAGKVRSLTGFTLQLFKDIFNKSFEHDDQNMSYWLAPLVEVPRPLDVVSEDANLLIDWSLVNVVSSREPYGWQKDMAKSKFEDKFVIDPWHGGRRLYTSKVEPSLRPSDPVPSDCAPARDTSTILNYSVSLWRSSANRRVWDDQQPVLAAEINSHRLNVLASPVEQEQAAKIKAFICLEPLLISLLPPDIAAMATIFPGIISRLESYMVAMEFYALMKLEVSADLALEALTKDSDRTEEHGMEKVNFQRGMGPNYERLEFLGDTFLKMSTTISIFSLHGASDEFHMHVDRMKMICNANLANHAKEKGYYKYIRGLAFSRRTWYPEGLKLLKGKAVGANDKVGLGDKTIADICEAAIGAALVAHVDSGHCELSKFDSAVRAVSHFVEDPNHEMLSWKEYRKAYEQKLPRFVLEESTASQRDLVEKLAAEHSYRFKSARVARSAFSHPSYPRSWEPGIPTYERLEFLGDSLLDMSCVLHLYTAFGGHRDPQWLTEHKMAMVSNKFLGALCVRLGFYKHLRHSHSTIEKAMRDFVAEITEIEAEHAGERNYWTLAREPPKCMPDIVEAYVGAIFVDSGFDFGQVQRFFDSHIKWFFEDMAIYDTYASNHPINRLRAFLEEAMGCRNYRLMASEMPSSDGMTTKALAGLLIHDSVVSQGHAGAVKNAKARAAGDFLRKAAGIAPFQFRQAYKCDCKPNEAALLAGGG